MTRPLCGLWEGDPDSRPNAPCGEGRVLSGGGLPDAAWVEFTNLCWRTLFSTVPSPSAAFWLYFSAAQRKSAHHKRWQCNSRFSHAHGIEKPCPLRRKHPAQAGTASTGRLLCLWYQTEYVSDGALLTHEAGGHGARPAVRADHRPHKVLGNAAEIWHALAN